MTPSSSTLSPLNGSGMNPTTFIAQMKTKQVATYGNQMRMPSSGRPAFAIWVYAVS